MAMAYARAISLTFVRTKESDLDEHSALLLGRSHCTSKIRDRSDVYEELSTFGFKGDALSALCSIGCVFLALILIKKRLKCLQ